MPDDSEVIQVKEVKERRRQVRGLLLIALAVIALSILRAGLHHVFTPGWWHLW